MENCKKQLLEHLEHCVKYKTNEESVSTYFTLYKFISNFEVKVEIDKDKQFVFTFKCFNFKYNIKNALLNIGGISYELTDNDTVERTLPMILDFINDIDYWEGK